EQYDVPRRADSVRVARSLDLDKSTVAEHLGKAERRLLTHVLGS
ncbi:MAG: helix-turn-helix domain-containing protein, partial [Thermoplasmata archaeon]